MQGLVYFSLLALSCLALNKEPTNLQIGIKKRIPDEDCKEKTKNGDNVRVHYQGKLFATGKAFDSSYERGSPLEFTLGQGRVIKGWERGLLNMCINEERKLVIPSDLAYGDRGHPPTIPPQATLVFEVKLMNFNDILKREEEAPIKETPKAKADTEAEEEDKEEL